MTVVSASEVKLKFGLFMDRAIKEPVVIEKYGRPYVVLVSKDYYDLLKESQEHNK